MKAEDLMTGNWVRSKRTNAVTIVTGIHSVNDGYIQTIEYAADRNINEYEEIPITKGFLTKNGFRELVDGDWELKYISGEQSIVYSEGVMYFAHFGVMSKDYTRICDCHYVHEFQNNCKMLGVDAPNGRIEA